MLHCMQCGCPMEAKETKSRGMSYALECTNETCPWEALVRFEDVEGDGEFMAPIIESVAWNAERWPTGVPTPTPV